MAKKAKTASGGGKKRQPPTHVLVVPGFKGHRRMEYRPPHWWDEFRRLMGMREGA